MLNGMKLVDIDIYLPGVNEIEKGDALKAVIASKAQAIASRASSMSNGASFRVEEATGTFLAFANVHPDDDAAVEATLKDNVILKSMGGA